MGAKLNEQDIKKEFIDSFPDNAGELAYYLWTDILELHYNWKNYRILFGTNKERIDLLNRYAPNYFGSLHSILLHDIILSIGRLTDPASSGKEKDNASINLLLKRKMGDISKNTESDIKDLLTKTQKTVFEDFMVMDDADFLISLIEEKEARKRKG